MSISSGQDMPQDSLLEIKAIGTFQSLGKRAAQEDFLLAQRERKIFVVADGFGGPSTEAAKRACEAVQSFLFKEAGDLDATLPFVLRTYFSLAGNVLFNALIHANRQLRKFNQSRNVHEKGGASVIAGFLDGDLMAIASVGDCNAWLFRDGQAVELVIPRTYSKLVNPLANDSQDDMRAPMMALGMAEDLEPEIVEYRVQEGDWIAFSTDGIPPTIKASLQDIQLSKFNSSETIKEFHQILDQVPFTDNAAISLIIF